MYRSLLAVLVFLFVVDAALARPIPYDTNSVGAAANNPRRAELADLDGDGDLDVLYSASSGDVMAWFEHLDGNGSFGPSQTIASSDFVDRVLAADFDGDGDLDTAFNSQFDDELTWYENTDGNGTFALGQVVAATGFRKCIAAGDLDRDGDVDLVSAGTALGDLAWFENIDGAGTFGGPQLIGNSLRINVGLQLADIDRDGDLDVVFGTDGSSSEVGWYANDGSGGFGAKMLIDTPGPSTLDLEVGDLDGDGDLDVVNARGGTTPAVEWYENTDGAGAFGPAQLLVDSPAGAAFSGVGVADLDGDGDLDVAAVEFFDETTFWIENTDGAGTFGTPTVIPTTELGRWDVTPGDVDQDGNVDLLVTYTIPDEIRWIRNETIHRDAEFPARETIETAVDDPRTVALSDLDRDGDLDLLSTSAADGKLAWHENTDGDATFGPQTVIDTLTGPWWVETADLDRDGDLDVYLSESGASSIAWYFNDGSGSFGAKNSVASGALPRVMRAADLDGDGDLDFLVCEASQNAIAWFENTDGAGTFGPRQEIYRELFIGPRGVFAADLDGDGDLDPMSASTNDDTLAWYPNQGGGSFGPRTIIDVAPSFAGWIEAADLDRDGDQDLVAVTGDGFVWYANDGAAGFGTAIVLGTGTGPEFITTGDVDLDGDLDVVGLEVLGDVVWFEGDGAGGFGPKQILGSGPALNFPRGVLGDADGDADLDLFLALDEQLLGGAETIAWHRNRGGQFSVPTSSGSATDVCGAQQTDVLVIDATHEGRTGDGDLELVTIRLLLEESPGDPLTTFEAGLLLDAVSLWRDDGSGAFEPGADTLVVRDDTLTLTGGVLDLQPTDGSAAALVAATATQRFFVVAETSAIATLQPQNGFCLTHRIEDGAAADDRDDDIALTLSFDDDASSCVTILPDGDADTVCDALDNCPATFNPGQEDADGDSDGNACDPDDDNDGVLDDGDGSGTDGDNPCTGGATTGCDDNCPFDANPTQADGNGNGVGTACETFCELVIGPGVGPDFPTIAAALPSAIDGCRLLVEAGTYTDPLVVDRYVRIIGLSGAASTIIDTGGAATAIDVVDRAVPGTVTIEDVTIVGATRAIDTDESLILEDVAIAGVTSGVRLGLGSHTLRRVTVLAGGGDGVELAALAEATLERVRVSGADVAVDLDGDAVLETCLLHDSGTGVRVSGGGSLDMRYSTLADSAKGIDDASSTVSVDHSIVWGNTDEIGSLPCTAFTFSDVGVDCSAVGGNLFADPLFVSPGTGDYSLSIASPAVEFGPAPELYDGRPCLDFDGRPRLLDVDGNGSALPDIGAYEFDNSGDLVPGDVANLRMPAKTMLEWDTEGDSTTYKINRGVLSTRGFDFVLTCLGSSATTAFAVTATPTLGDGFYYVVSGVEKGGEEGTLGFGTCAERSKISAPCP